MLREASVRSCLVRSISGDALTGCPRRRRSSARQVLLLELGSPAEFLGKAIEPPPPKMIRAALRNLYELQVTSSRVSLMGGGCPPVFC